MKKLITLLGLAAFAFAGQAVAAEKGFKSIFDGKSLKGWNGDPKFWSVQDGAITGKTTKENPTKGNTFIIWDGGKTGDFDLRLDYKIVGGNSGIQYRSFKLKTGQTSGVLVDIRATLTPGRPIPAFVTANSSAASCRCAARKPR